MEHKKCGHEDSRKKVCAPCGLKISLGKKTANFFRINDKIEAQIRKFINPHFDRNCPKFPLSICNTCRLTLSQYENNKILRYLPKMPNYYDIIIAKETRATNMCNCYICLTGRFHGKNQIQKGRGHKRETSVTIDGTNGLNGTSAVTSLPSTRKQADKKVSKHSICICKTCNQQIGRGIRHSCGSVAKACQNVSKLVENLPNKQQDQIAAGVIKRKIIDQNVELSSSISTRGSKMRISVNPKVLKQRSIPLENLDNFRVNEGIPYNLMKKFNNFIRSNVGRKAIPAHYEKHMTETSNILDYMYHVVTMNFDTDIGTEKRPVIWADAQELLECIIEKRQFIGHVNVKVMADSGQGFFKVSIAVFPETNNEVGIGNLKKRNLYAEGGTTGKKSVFTSVNRLLCLCIVPKIKETYTNIKQLFDLINLNKIPFKFVSDFKILLLVNGQQTASATFPCPYCFISRQDLKDRNHHAMKNSMMCNISDVCSEAGNNSEFEPLTLKTYGDLVKDSEKFYSLGNDKKVAKECHSTVNSPLFVENPEVYVIQKCVIPELHIMQGYVNHLFWDKNGLVDIVGREKALLWPHKLNIISKNYQGDLFEGNACRTLLKEADKLIDPDIYDHRGPLLLVPLVSAFKAMDKVVSLYFSIRRVDNEVKKHISALRKCFDATNVTETLKIHVLLEHLEECLHFLDGHDGLGIWSEQSGESIHRIFLNFWGKRKINMMNNEHYSTNLKKAVVEFSSLHL